MTGQQLRRFIILLSLVLLFIGLLIFRLAYIQLVSAESFSPHQINLLKQSAQQRQEELILKSGRGAITDRHGHMLTGQVQHVLVMFPLSKRTVHKAQLQEVATILNTSVQDLLQQMNQSEPVIYTDVQGIRFITQQEVERINALNIPGLLGLPYELRYPLDERMASHLLGYLGQNPEWIRNNYPQEVAQGILHENSVIGISGLERTFQPFLQGVGPVSLAYYVDGRGDPLYGLGLKYIADDNPFFPLTVQTTLDRQLQQKVEHVLDKVGIEEGTVVILDSETSEILAMASRPTPLERDFSHPSWQNKGLKRFVPGSVFKVVVAAAALEEGLASLDTVYECPGHLADSPFKCWKEDGHGTLTFAQAFYQSCNIVFGQLAEELGDERLEEYAHKLGLLQLNGWQTERLFHLEDFKQLDREEKGQVFHQGRTNVERSDSHYLWQTGIGQLDVQLSPLAVANMMASISRGGSKKYQVKAVSTIEYETGGTFYLFRQQSLEGPTISPYTAYQLQQLLRGVVTSGTAKKLSVHPLAGKTGTAQGGSKKVELRWFAGFYPVDQPRYALAVVVLNQKPDEANQALEVVDQLLNQLPLEKP